ncbi:leucine-rich repeat-containing protein 3-like [Saccostrea cucullata]|uniref:leucine-rich repeat-containing protein 3-like n=1 Tax=Saccostrea cuccullata TaxID=36930 RepID=UPI002ED5FC39
MTLIVWTLVFCVLMYGTVTKACPSVCDCWRTGLCNGTYVSCDSRGLTEVPTNIPTDTCQLDLSYNKITTIQDNAFASLYNLRELDLYGNEITTIQDNVFASLYNLRKLDLANNEITTIQDNVFASLYNLSVLTGKDKLDQIKRPKTGGGKPIALTTAQDLFLQSLEGRPQIEGIASGIDTDEISGFDSTVGDGPTCSDSAIQEENQSDTRNNTRNRGKLAELEEENMTLDNQRLRMQINQQNANKEIMTLKKEILMPKKSKLEFEILANISIFY